MYQDVIKDIKESKLTEEERIIELEWPIESRMEVCEDPNGILEKLKLKRSDRFTAKENLQCEQTHKNKELNCNKTKKNKELYCNKTHQNKEFKCLKTNQMQDSS